MSGTPEEIEIVADAILDDLLDRRGIRQELEGIKDRDPEIYFEIKHAIGSAAISAYLEAKRLPPQTA